jgi:amylosucrase
LLHSVILSFGGIPLLYYGDELGTTNDYTWLNDPAKSRDSRWLHRPLIDWKRAERRLERGTVEERIFSGLKKLIAVRKTVPVFADFNNRTLLAVDNDHVLAYRRTPPGQTGAAVVVLANFDSRPQAIDLLDDNGRTAMGVALGSDLVTGVRPAIEDDTLTIPAHGYYWLPEVR